MVLLPNFETFRPQSEKATVKLEIEDPLEEDHGPLNKKSKWGEDGGMVPPQPAQCSLLDEPSPLGLRLRKSPSLLDLIQMRLSQGNLVSLSNEGFETGKKELKSTAVSGATDKLKASNFPVSLLRIGSWECVSRYEGDLVAKCYYAKHKLVWEVLDGGLKSKIEIQWSDITALQAACPENAPGILDIVLARQPLFFRETNPQPRKHTLWQATSDFTNGQASTHRRHFLQCPPGLLNKHFEKLIQCDPRLHSLSQQPNIILESSYFEPGSSVFEGHDESTGHSFDNQKDGFGSTISGFRDHVSICATSSTYSKNETKIPIARLLPNNVTQDNFSASSVIYTRVMEKNPTTSGTKELLNDSKTWDQIKVPGLRSSMSMSELVNHIGHCISGQTTPGNPLLPRDSSLNKSALEELTQYLLGDSQVNSASDEQSLMSRVNSLCCLIQHKNPTIDDDDNDDDESDNDVEQVDTKSSMSRKESYGELLMHLPRIASMPFLFNIAEDSDNQAV